MEQDEVSPLLDITAHLAALELLLRHIYTDRARKDGLNAATFGEGMDTLADSIDGSARRGFDGEEEMLELVKEHLQSFSAAVQTRLGG